MIAFASPSPDPRRYLPLSSFIVEALADKPPDSPAYKNTATAVIHFGRFLRRQPTVADLASRELESLAAWLLSKGRRRGTANRVCQDLVRLGKAAVAAGLLELIPYYQKLPGDRRLAAFSLAELERILAAALEMPGDLDGAPAKDWWPAFLLTVLNTQLAALSLLSLPRDALDLGQATIRAGGLVYCLHHNTAAALAKITAGQPSARLFPWKRKLAIDMLHFHLKKILQRAGVPLQKCGGFERLRITIEHEGSAILDRLDASRIERERRAVAIRAEHAVRRESDRRAAEAQRIPAFRRRAKRDRQVYVIGSDSPRTVRTFLREVYAPLRLAARSPRTVEQYECALNVAAHFAGGEITLDGLSADFLDRLAAWIIRTGRTAHTANKTCRSLLCIWRYAIRKRHLPPSAEPDLFEKLKTPKRAPRTFTLTEFERLLFHAARLRGELASGVKAATLLPAVLLTAYFTGLRIGAILRLRVNDLGRDGWLFVPAEFQKHGADQRFLLPDVALSAIQAIEPGNREMLFCGPPSEANFRRLKSYQSRLRKLLKRALAAAELPTTSRWLFHCLRRLSATQMAIAAGKAAATEHLGHSSPALLAFYLDQAQLAKPNAGELLPRPNLDLGQPPRVAVAKPVTGPIPKRVSHVRKLDRLVRRLQEAARESARQKLHARAERQHTRAAAAHFAFMSLFWNPLA